MFTKDEDEEYSPSHPLYFQHADHGKAELREAKAREKGELLKLQRQVLRGEVTNKKSVKQADAQDEKEAKAAEDAKKTEKANQSFHTETLKEKEEKKTEKTSALPDAADVAKRAQSEPEISDEETMNEPG